MLRTGSASRWLWYDAAMSTPIHRGKPAESNILLAAVGKMYMYLNLMFQSLAHTGFYDNLFFWVEQDRPHAPLIVRSPFRAKHLVVVSYMVGWMKCPLPPPPSPLPDPLPLLDPPPSEKTRTRKNLGHHRQGTSHCSCLEHCFLFSVPPAKLGRRGKPSPFSESCA